MHQYAKKKNPMAHKKQNKHTKSSETERRSGGEREVYIIWKQWFRSEKNELYKYYIFSTYDIYSNLLI